MAGTSIKTLVKTLVEPGAVIDGFTIGECVHRVLLYSRIPTRSN